MALVATAFIGSATVLSGGQAKALNCTFAAGIINGCAYGAQWNGAPGNPIPPGPKPPLGGIAAPFYGQWLDTNIDVAGTAFYYPTDKEINFVNGPTTGTGAISWDWVDVNNNGTWEIPPIHTPWINGQ